MSTLFDNFVVWHESHSHLIRALIAGVLVSTVCGVIGCFIILRRMAFLGDALAHAMLAGVVSGFCVSGDQLGNNHTAFQCDFLFRHLTHHQ